MCRVRLARRRFRQLPAGSFDLLDHCARYRHKVRDAVVSRHRAQQTLTARQRERDGEGEIVVSLVAHPAKDAETRTGQESDRCRACRRCVQALRLAVCVREHS